MKKPNKLNNPERIELVRRLIAASQMYIKGGWSLQQVAAKYGLHSQISADFKQDATAEAIILYVHFTSSRKTAPISNHLGNPSTIR